MNRHTLVWGWLRLGLGFAQIVFSTAGIMLLFIIGQDPLTWSCFIAATFSTIVSRALYHGRPDPNLNQQKGRNKRS